MSKGSLFTVSIVLSTDNRCRQELSSFIDQPEIITQVALVKPRPGVFIDDISHILVVCTHVTVILLGLSSSQVPGPDNRQRREIKLYATDMTVTTDGVEMTSVVGTDDGRIFMCGASDGNLYELHYQEKEAWFGKRLQLINHSAGGLSSFIPILRTAQSDGTCLAIAHTPFS
jgi:nuclear pore complex protein Nup155